MCLLLHLDVCDTGRLQIATKHGSGLRNNSSTALTSQGWVYLKSNDYSVVSYPYASKTCEKFFFSLWSCEITVIFAVTSLSYLSTWRECFQAVVESTVFHEIYLGKTESSPCMEKSLNLVRLALRITSYS